MHVVFLGPSGSGKSTLTGHLLYLSGTNTNDDLDLIKGEMGDSYDESMKFAYLMDEEQEEREMKKTINTNYKLMGAMMYNLVLIDTPGDPAYAQNMIGEISKGDVAVLVIPADLEEFNKGFENKQYQDYILLSLAMSIEQFVVVINYKVIKGDQEDENAYNKIKAKLTEWMQLNGINLLMTPFVPVNAFEGDNLKEESSKFGFYGGGPLEIELLSQRLPDRYEEKPLRLPISKVIEVDGDNIVLEGSIETGELKKGQELYFLPDHQTGTVTDIKFFGEPMEIGDSGNYITFTVKGKELEGSALEGKKINEVKRGDVASPFDSLYRAKIAYKFETRVVISNCDEGIKEGEEYEMHFNTTYANCTIDRIHYKIKGDSPDYDLSPIKTNESAVLTIKPQENKVIVDLFKDYPSCGKFAIRGKNGHVAGFGVVRKISEV